MRSEQGAVAIIVAICLVLLFTFAALAVDLGFWLTARRQMQSAADAAALAGCRELADGGDDTAVWDAVVRFANSNFTTPVDLSDSFVVSPSPGGLSEIGGDYVKVTVRTIAPSFFARVIGFDEGRIAAQSVARIGYLGGGRGPVPWGLSVLHVGDMSATIGGHTVSMWDAGDGKWAGSFPQGASGPITIRATNDSGYQEQFTGLVSVGALPAGGRITAVDVEKSTFTSGVDSTCRIEVSLESSLAAGGSVSVSVGHSKTSCVFDPASGRYVANVGIPSTADPYVSVPIEVEVKEGRSTQAASCNVLVRRANYILEDVEVEPMFARPTDAVAITVETLEFDFGVRYQLKVEGGAGSTGNFLALDFASASLEHSLCGYPDTPVSPGGGGGAGYEEDIVGDPNLTIHLLDLVDTMTGNMVGPTNQGLADRLNGVSMQSFAEWRAAGEPETKQLLLVPITEKIEDLNGKSQLKVISFATFFLEQCPQGSQDPVVGRFVEYTAPGWVVVNNPPGPLAIQAVHLVSDHLDF